MEFICKTIEWCMLYVRKYNTKKYIIDRQIERQIPRQIDTYIDTYIDRYIHRQKRDNVVTSINMILHYHFRVIGLFQAPNYKSYGETNLYVDGGVLCNYPIHCFDGQLVSILFNIL